MVGFEIESHTGINAKHVKGSVSNLCNLGALMGVIVLERENLEGLRKRSSIHREQSEKELWKHLLDKVEQWVYAEAQPKMRLVIMKEADIINWAKNEGINIQGN